MLLICCIIDEKTTIKGDNILLRLRWVCVTYRRILDWMIQIIDNLYIHLVTTSNGRPIAISALYSSLLQTLVSSIFTSINLATDS
jgi:hypothetical protein